MATGTFDIIHPGHGHYLKQAKQLGGKDSKLIVVIATDKTVEKHKRTPIIGQEQRLETIAMLKYVDEAYVGDDFDPFKIVKKIKPDIIAIGPDQKFIPEKLKQQLKQVGIDVDVIKVNDYKKGELDSTCKIIKKIKKTEFHPDTFRSC
ncbi:MAG: adenylyltransferase/cytidyltransferase family protein [Methanobacteriaceae archaeon]|nr:adenylyltransferase/cytidyltransferase family protein [Methanobacteriaceae archaeon]